MIRKRILVIGLGRFGASIVQTLWEKGSEIVVVDRSSDAIAEVREHTHAAFIADGTDHDVLASVNAKDMDAAIVTFGQAFEAAVLTVASLKKLGVTNIVARAETDRQAEVLRAVGATRVLQLEEEMGERVGLELTTPATSDILDFAGDYRVVPWTASGSVVGKSLRDAHLRQRFEVNVIGIRPLKSSIAGGCIALEPTRPDYVIQEGDTLLLVGEKHAVDRFLEKID
jgi:trk system potassium uptake protein TrkA